MLYSLINYREIYKSMEQLANTLELSLLLSFNNSVELIKSRYQTMAELITRGSLLKHYEGITDCAKTITSQEGVRALWKGNSISLLRFFPHEALSYEIKNFTKSFLPSGSMFNVASGISGGLFAATVFYPIDTSRVYITTSKERVSESVNQLKKIVRSQGVRYLYRGFSSCILGIIIFRGVFYGFYDTFKGEAQNMYEKWLIAYTSGFLAGYAMYPFETLRKRNIVCQEKVQEWKLLKKIISSEGYKALFRGCSLNTLQSLLASGVLLYFDKQQSK